ncbi:MAG: hypothetical protein ABSG33_07735, partial [Candidatus Bathyarchaeia archaeon]
PPPLRQSVFVLGCFLGLGLETQCGWKRVVGQKCGKLLESAIWDIYRSLIGRHTSNGDHKRHIG